LENTKYKKMVEDGFENDDLYYSSKRILFSWASSLRERKHFTTSGR